MKAFAILEFLVFIAILSVIIVAMLGTISLKLSIATRDLQPDILHNITICNKLSRDCVFDSGIVDSKPFFETNPTATTATTETATATTTATPTTAATNPAATTATTAAPTTATTP